jgi:hypothetical protein
MSRPDNRIFNGRTIERHGHGFHNGKGQFDVANSSLARIVKATLDREYAGHPWHITAEVEHGIVKIALSGMAHWAMVVKVSDLKGDPSLKLAKKSAGELLERYGMSRLNFSMADWQKANSAFRLVRNRNPERYIG